MFVETKSIGYYNMISHSQLIQKPLENKPIEKYNTTHN